MKLLLTSAGLENKSIIKALQELVIKPFSELKIAFIPTAANVEKGNKLWLIKDYLNLKKQKYKFIDIVDIASIPKEIWLPRLKNANVIFVGGGNTFYLMSWIKKSGLDKELPLLLKNRVYVGISAGSMVISSNLQTSTSSKSYSKKVFPLKNEKGLSFVDFQVRPHFNSKHFPTITTRYLEKIAKNILESIYAIDDNSAIKIDGDKIEIISEGSWKKFN